MWKHIERVRLISETQIRDQQSGFRKGGSCVDQVFVLRCVCEKYLEKKKEAFVAFMDMEKAYDRVNMQTKGEMLRIYGVGSKILSAIKSMY
jgi:hypothetical protein